MNSFQHLLTSWHLERFWMSKLSKICSAICGNLKNVFSNWPLTLWLAFRRSLLFLLEVRSVIFESSFSSSCFTLLFSSRISLLLTAMFCNLYCAPSRIFLFVTEKWRLYKYVNWIDYKKKFYLLGTMFVTMLEDMMKSLVGAILGAMFGAILGAMLGAMVGARLRAIFGAAFLTVLFLLLLFRLAFLAIFFSWFSEFRMCSSYQLIKTKHGNWIGFYSWLNNIFFKNAIMKVFFAGLPEFCQNFLTKSVTADF